MSGTNSLNLSPSGAVQEEEVYIFPASFAQQRLWFLDQLEPGSAFYNIPTAVRLKGRLDHSALQRSLNEIAQRHETLRTTFADQDGQPVQVIHEARGVPLSLIDLSGLEAGAQDAEVDRLASEEARKPFDLFHGPLVRARLLRISESDHVMIVNMHHIISDGWSVSLFIREMATLYEAFTSGKPSPLPPLPIQYADFSCWQQDWLKGAVLQEQIDYWKRQLSGSQSVLSLPTDRPRPAMQTFNGATRSVRIPLLVLNGLKALAQRENATLFMTLLAAFQTLLHRHSDQEDISVGTPIANRNQSEIEGLIGFFVNTLVIRSELSGEQSFRSLLQQVRETTLQAYAHQDIPFENVVEAAQPVRDPSYNPLFQVMFILQNVPVHFHELPGMTMSMMDAEMGTSTFDLTLSVTEGPDGLDASLEYNTDLFDESTILRMLGHYQTLLEGILHNPDEKLDRLPLITPEERRQLLSDWTNTTRFYPNANRCIQQLFEEAAAAYPDQIALVWPASGLDIDAPSTLTYGELNRRANQLAHYLQKLGVRQGSVVGICLERSLEMIVGIWGILKAGGAYLPLDPNYPSDRIEFILEDSQVTVLLSQSATAQNLPVKQARLVCLDTDWPQIETEDDQNPACASTPDALAYLIYTSGTTGRPKGVMVRQRNIVNAFLAWKDEYRLHEVSSHFQMANFAFDVFSGDLVRALCSGGKLVLCPHEFLLSPRQLYALMFSQQVDIAEFVPSVLRTLIQYLQETGQNLAFMKLLICGSDIWYVGEYQDFERMIGADTRLVNSFGLTEATIDSSYFESRGLDLPRDRLVPIGKPFPNTQFYILNKQFQPNPIGVPGELFVGGEGVAVGYLNRPELTQERFIENPFRSEVNIPRTRLYKTGDLARYLPDGNVEFLGRLDYQVKIRGFRIEIGEIESTLRQHPAVQDAVVVAAQKGKNSPQLVAYLVANLAVDRVPLKVACEIIEDANHNESPSFKQAIPCTTTDLSFTGVSISNAPGDWPVGQALWVKLPLPSMENASTLHARVAWRHDGCAGLLFDLTTEQQGIIHAAVKRIGDMQGAQVTDLRQGSPRLPMHGPCQVQREQLQQATFELENISTGGARLLNLNGDSFNAQESVRIGVQLPAWPEVLWLNAVVLWKRDEHTGIKFVLDSSSQERLNLALEATVKAQAASVGDLRAHLKDRLPDYMVPSMFVMLDYLPLTHNGKVDRKALPAPDWSRSEREDTYVAPCTPTEEILAGVWMQLLGVDTIGIKDNFFELGGHSLLATQLISRVRDAFHVEIPLRSVFEAPTVESMSQVIDAARRSGQKLNYPPFRRVPRGGALPLSFAQQRLWFLDQLEPGSPFYNLPESVRLTGKLNIPALEKSLNEIIRRHEVLRTTFISIEGRPQLVIAPELHLPLEITDLRHLSGEDLEAEVARLANAEVMQPFDLSASPLLRARLLILGEEENLALLTFHHIIGDDWSSRVFIQEMAILYDAYSKGLPSPLPELELQYADFASWQREWLQGEVLQAQLDYWKEKLAAIPPVLELPTDRPRPSMQTFNGAVHLFTLPKNVLEGLRALSLRGGATMFMTLLAVFKTLLYRYTGEEHVAVGTPIANRNWAEIENLIGFFVNTLVLHTDLSGEPGFIDLLKRVSETALGAYTHQDLPFEMLVDQLHPERNLSHSPLFQVMFVMQNEAVKANDIPDLQISPYEVHTGTAKFDLTLFMIEESDTISGVFEYNTDLFDRETIERMAACFQTLVASILAEPEKPITRLEILPEAEKYHILQEWNATEKDFPRERCAHELFEDQVALSPDAVALSYLERSMTYRELDERANRLAHYLQSLGVGPETLVGLCLHRSPEMLVGILGVLKSGGAYVPLDPAYPAERLAYMIEDSRAPVLLTQQDLAENLEKIVAGECPVKVVCLDSGWEEIAQQPAGRPVCKATPENLAYVIYTSGSTGKPKGAMIIHRGLVNYLTWTKVAYPLDKGQGSPVHSSFSFDLTVTSLYSPLISGKRVLLLPEDLGVEALGEALRAENNFSLVKITPAHLQLLGSQLAPGQAAGKTHAFIIGGENLLVDHVAFWQAFSPETELVNEYGPTETVVGCCVYWTPLNKIKTGVIPIGKPIINTRLYILDQYRQPVPVGVHGELYIGGEGVGRGYLNQPELSAEKFMPDPFSGQPGARMYRSGDLVRYQADGNIECLGRIDFQVKIRGFRVELGEVENAIGQHPGVKETVVWVREEGGVKRLIAYFVPQDPDSAPSVHELREFLQKDLPDYMVPSAFVQLEALPLTSNGKIDRKALPEPDQDRPDIDTSYIAPRTPQEEVLARIWSQLLGVERVGANDNFFELGGDSILSIQVIARARQAGLNLTPRQLFEAQTVAGLAALAGEARPTLAEQGTLSGRLPLTPVQRWFFQDLPEHAEHWNQSLLLEIQVPLERAALETAVRALMQQHDVLRLRYISSGDSWIQVYDNTETSELPFHWVDLKNHSEVDQTDLIEQTAARLQTSLDLSRGPLIRVAYFDAGANNPGRLFITIHHLAVDGVSWRILLEDLQTVYLDAARGIQPQFSPKTTSYRQWAERLNEWVNSSEVKADLAYWRSQLSAEIEPLPVDFNHGENTESSSASVSVALSSGDTSLLLTRLLAARHTDINSVLLSALAGGYRRWCGASGLLVELEGHGREDLFEDVDLSRTLGWFTSLYPVYLPLAGLDPLEMLDDTTRRLQQIPHHGLTFGMLAYLSKDTAARDLLRQGAHPQITFNYLGQMDQALGGDLQFFPAQESSGPERSPAGLRRSLIDVNGGVAGGQLRLEWTYSRSLHRESTVRALAEQFINTLREIIHAGTADNTPDEADSVFGWSSSDIDNIFDALEKGKNHPGSSHSPSQKAG